MGNTNETEKKDNIIRSWMENYPEAGRCNSLKCLAYNYDKMEFTFFDDEEEKCTSINLKNLRSGLKVFLELIKQGKYRNSMGNIPHVIAEGYEDDSQDHDALVQCTIFKEVRYG